MNKDKVIQYLQDVVNLEIQRRTAYNTERKLIALENDKAYAKHVDVNMSVKGVGVTKKISWGTAIIKTIIVFNVLLLAMGLLVFLMPESTQPAMLTFCYIISFIVACILVFRKEMKVGYDRVEYDKASKQQYLNKAKQDQLILAQIQRDKPNLEKVYNQCTANLRTLYSLNIIHPDYQDFVACGMFLQYLSTGRTHSLEQYGGDPGAYNLYEQDVKFNVIKKQLDQIQRNQQVIYGALVQINQNVHELSSSVSRIENYAKQTAQNTKISAWCDQANAINIYAMRRMQEGYR